MGCALVKPVAYYKKQIVSFSEYKILKVTIDISSVPQEAVSKEIIIPLTQTYKNYGIQFTNNNNLLIFNDISSIDFNKVILKMPKSFILKHA